MCSRYALVSKRKALERELQVEFLSDFEPGYNVFLGKEMPVVLSATSMHMQTIKWGLVPSWSKWTDINYHYNAFVSDIVKHPAYRVPIRKYRCLVPVNCFYIWMKDEKKGKQPWVVYVKDQRIFTLAGVYDVRRDWLSGELFYSYAIISTYCNKHLAKFFPTMPAIIPPSRRSRFLKSNLPLHEVMRMLRPFETDRINLYPVSKKVNDPLNDSSEIIQPCGERLFRE